MHRRNIHIVVLAFVHNSGRAQRRSALPLFDDARVARARHAGRTEISEHIHAVLVDPAHSALGFRQLEAVFNPGFADQIKFARDAGIRPATGQFNQAALIGRLRMARSQAVGAMPYPVLALKGVQRIDVQHSFPGGLDLAVLLQRGATPQSTWVGGVNPEVVIVRADFFHERDIAVAIEHRQKLGLQRLEAVRLREACSGLLVLRPYPVQRPGTVDLFKPLVRIVEGGGFCWEV